MWYAKWRVKLNPEKTKVIISSRSYLARQNRTQCRDTKSLSSSEILIPNSLSENTLRTSWTTATPDVARYHRLKLLANKKWGPCPSTIIQIYKQCALNVFVYGCLSTIITSDNIISKIQQLQNKFIRLALPLPKCICAKLHHDPAGLPYVKDRFPLLCNQVPR